MMFKRWRRGASLVLAGPKGRSEDGSVAITATATLVLLSTVVMLVLRSGHAATVKRELQSAADAAAMALAAQIRESGVQAQSDGKIALSASIRQVIDTHTKLPYTVDGRLLDEQTEGNTTFAVVEITLTAQYTSPFNLIGNGQHELIYKSRARVRQTTIGGAKKWPAALLMVDRSASMETAVKWGGSQSRWEVLKQIVNTFASNPFPIRLGMMTFHRFVDDGVHRVAPPPDNTFNGAAIRSALQGLDVDHGNVHGLAFWKWDPASTNFKKAFETARDMLRNDPSSKKRVVLISDGNPTSGGNNFLNADVGFLGWKSANTTAREGARALRQSGVALHAVGLRTVGRSGILGALTNWLEGESVLPRLAGPANSTHSDRNFAHVVDIDSINDTQRFLAILAESFCTFPVDPIQQAGGTMDLTGSGTHRRLFVFMDDGTGDEQLLDLVSDLTTSENRDRLAFKFVPTNSEVRLTMKACRQLGNSKQGRLVIRWGNTELVSSPMAQDKPIDNKGGNSGSPNN